ncbi:MAG: phosphate ABC transporter permease PstA [Acidimicrobiia bacterium]|nr:phosphate ABC transporter permease PstA [Acidimicrobiia bacterium]
MATVDLALTRDITVGKSLRGKRVDVPGVVFQAALLFCLFVCLAFIVLLFGIILDDGLGTFQNRGFVISDFPSELEKALSETWTFLTHPEGLVGWFATLVAFVGLPLAIFFSVRGRYWKFLIAIVVGFAIVFGIAALVGTSDFLTSDLSRFPERAGVSQAIFGTVFLALMTAVVAFPLGIATAVFLEEYAPDNRLIAFVRLNIRNLAGVPSVVYGLLGLAIFVQLLGTDIGDIPVVGGTLFDVFGEGGITGGRTIIAGGFTLAILVLPIVIITSSEALRAVPQSLREGGYGVGATKWEVTKSLVMPNAFAGILTGTILSLSRAIGETAPLILVGAFFGTFFTTGNAGLSEKFSTTYTALPQVVYQWATDAKTEFRLSLTASAILVLLVITILANVAAVLLRNRYEKRW